MFLLRINNSVRIKSLIDQEVTKITNPLQDLQKVNLENFTESQLKQFKSLHYFRNIWKRKVHKCLNKNEHINT